MIPMLDSYMREIGGIGEVEDLRAAAVLVDVDEDELADEAAEEKGVRDGGADGTGADDGYACARGGHLWSGNEEDVVMQC